MNFAHRTPEATDCERHERPGTDARLASRSAWAAVKRGLRRRCPACGVGRMLHGYLRVHDACPACGEELHHQRADDFPPYVTIFVVGHLVGGAMFAVDEAWPNLPTTFHIAVWPLAAVLLSLWLLPLFKGALVAYQWALRMHGFETSHRTADVAEAEPLTPRASA